MTARTPTPGILDNLLSGATPSPPAAPAATKVPLASIVNDGGTQMRAALSADTITDYEAVLAEADAWPFPPVVVFYDGAKYWLADGFHRLNAAHRSGKFTEIPADVRAGTQRDAILHAAGANAAHGLRRTNADKRRSVEVLLRDEEWSKWSKREIARRCGVSDVFVADVLKDIQKELSANGLRIDDSPQRTVQRNGTTYQQNTANIGARPATRMEIYEIETVVRHVASEERATAADLRTMARQRIGRVWLECRKELPADVPYRDLAQAMNNVATQIEAQRSAAPAPAPATPAPPPVDGDRPLPDWAQPEPATAAQEPAPVAPAAATPAYLDDRHWALRKIEIRIEHTINSVKEIAKEYGDLTGMHSDALDAQRKLEHMRAVVRRNMGVDE